jgi:hypothetical protein
VSRPGVHVDAWDDWDDEMLSLFDNNNSQGRDRELGEMKETLLGGRFF